MKPALGPVFMTAVLFALQSPLLSAQAVTEAAGCGHLAGAANQAACKAPAAPGSGAFGAAAHAAINALSINQTATIAVGNTPIFALANQTGTLVYVSNNGSASVSVIDTATNAVVATIPVGNYPARMAISPDGTTLYVANGGGGISVIDTASNAVTGTINTGSYNLSGDLALTPDGTKLYVPFIYSGVGLVSLPSQSLSIISTTLCPEGTAITPDGSQLFVTYQCGGPGGSGGHDAIGVFSVATNAPTASITGLPNVGHPYPSISPDGTQFWESGSDACSGDYDGVGCPSSPGIPESVINVIQVSNDNLLTSIGFSNPDGPGYTTSFSPDGSTAFVGGNTSLKLVDTTTFATTTTLPIAASGSVAFVTFGSVDDATGAGPDSISSSTVAYAPVPASNQVVVFSFAPSSLIPPTVTFTGAPESATYGTSFVVTATTNASTTATITASGACTASGSLVTMTSGTGTCMLTANWAADGTYSSASAMQSTAAVPASQMITFGTIPTQTVGTPLGLNASASSGLAVAYSVAAASAAVCSVSTSTSGSTANFLNPGNCTITASQAGNGNYAPATPVTQTFTVKSSQSFTLSLATGTVTIPSGGVGATDVITIVDAGGFNGSVALSATLPTLSSSEFTDAFLPASTATNSTFVIVAQPGVTPGQYIIPIKGASGNLSASTNLTVNVTGTQTITFGPIPTQTVGKPLTLTATASSGLAVTYSAAPSNVCAISTTGATATFSGAGVCSITASQSGGTYYSAAKPVTQSFTVQLPPSFTLTLASPAVTIPSGGTGATDAVTVVDAGGFTGSVTLSATLPGGFSDAFVPNNPTSTNSTFVIVAQSSVTPGLYNIPINGVSGSLSASVNLPVTVTGTQTITFGTIPTQTVGTPLTLTATASSGLLVSYTASPSTVCTVSGSTATFVGTGTCSITAMQSGGAYYLAATPVTQSFHVQAPPPTFTLAPATSAFTLARGNGGTDIFTISPVNGFKGTVTLTVTGFPANTSGVFYPASVNAGSTASTPLVAYVSSTATPGTYPLTITGTSGTVTVTKNIYLVVQ